MNTNIRSSRASFIVAWAVASLFLLGFFYPPVGTWTGPIVGTWFVGTQKPWRGFLWMVAFGFIPSLISQWRNFPVIGLEPAIEYLGWMLLAAVLAVLPFTFHRLVSPRLPGFLFTLPLPLAGVAIPWLFLPLNRAAASRVGLDTFFVLWLAAMIVWLWSHESPATVVVFGAGFVLVTGYELLRHFGRVALPLTPFAGATFQWICLVGAVALSIYALFQPRKYKSWADRPETVSRLRSPFTGNSLQLVSENDRVTLVSASGERFPIRDGIPAFLKPEDLTGDNGKYNHLYQTIGGFYDDIQRIFCALKGFDREAYFRSYMSRLEVKPGESVLETSVGTGLNYKYLPRTAKLSGLDLSPEMLANCQANLSRWGLDADLYLGNAESLPFADSSFDVVFHVGGINFFNDRAKAIREMIRVAKPGSLLLIADETEKHVKEVYEKGLGGALYKNRAEPVKPPVDLVPPEMQDIHLEQMRFGDWYTLTFRKPVSVEGPCAGGENRIPTRLQTEQSE